jgi:hypothetical protein
LGTAIWTWAGPPSHPVPALHPHKSFYVISLGLTQKIKDPPRTTETSEKTIDLFLTDGPSLVNSAKVVPGVSDHDALIATLSVSSVQPSSAPREVYNFEQLSAFQERKGLFKAAA